MLEIISALLSVWLFVGAVKLIFKMTWGAAKIAASILLAVAIPALILCLIFASGLIVLIPVGLTALAFGIVKAFV